MATATTGTVEREVVTVEEVEEVTLSLSPEEASFLYDLIGNKVVGSAKTSRRKYGDQIYQALGDAGVVSDMPGGRDYESNSNIFFIDREDIK